MIDQSLIDLRYITGNMFNNLPYNILHNFIISQEKSIGNFFSRKILFLNGKLKRLKSINISNIPTIAYSVKQIKDNEHSSINFHHKLNFYLNYEFSLSNFDCDTSNHINIEIKLEHFNSIDPSDITLNNKWFVNLTSNPIPREVSELVQLGDRFVLPCRQHKKMMGLKTLKDSENNISRFSNTEKHNLRTHITNYLLNFISTNNAFSKIEENILHRSRAVSTF